MTHPVNRRTALAGLGATLALPAWAQSGSIVIYTSNNQQAFDAVVESAKTRLPGVKFSAITGGSGQLLRRLEAEAAKPQGDIFWSSSANTLGAFKTLYEPYRSPELAAVPAGLHQPQNLWSAANLHVVVAMVNTQQLGGPAPKTWADLLDARFKGKITIADPANSSTALTILWGVDKMLGADALKRLAGNVKVTSAAATVLRSVGQGEFAVGLTFESNAYAYVAGGQKEIALVYPSDGTFTSPEYFALIKGAPAGELAKKACDLLLSRQAQTELLLAAYRRPARSDIDVSKHVQLPPLAGIKVFPIDEDEAAAKRADFIKRWQALVAAAGN
ncbi:MAG: extracellular solute-binding protein [Burkholderiaceae bacterium]